MKDYGFPDIKVVELPGHSMGSIGLLVSDDAILVGDALDNWIKPGMGHLYTDIEALKKAIIAEDYEVVEEPKAKTLVIRVKGMMCSHCTAAVEKACMSVLGTVKAVASLEEKNVTVTGTADYEALKKAIIAEDYEVVE